MRTQRHWKTFQVDWNSHAEGGGPGRGQNAAKTRLPPGQEYTVFDIPGAPPLRFGPSKARFVGNDAKNTVQKDLTGSGTLYTK